MQLLLFESFAASQRTTAARKKSRKLQPIDTKLKAWPKQLAAQQFHRKQARLIDNRLQEALGNGLLVVDGRVLTSRECFSLLNYLQMQLLPELYDPDFDGNPIYDGTATTPDATDAPDALNANSSADAD